MDSRLCWRVTLSVPGQQAGVEGIFAFRYGQTDGTGASVGRGVNEAGLRLMTPLPYMNNMSNQLPAWLNPRKNYKHTLNKKASDLEISS